MTQEIYGFISLIFAVASYLPYIWSTWRGNTRPHVFTWLIWSIVMAIGAAGQYAGDAGPGAWATMVSALSCLAITVLAARQGEKDITAGDFRILISALIAIPLWIFTKNPLTAIIVVTIVDLIGYVPTLRKSYANPKGEMAMHYVITNFKHIFSFFAMTVYSMTTLLYPAVLFVANSILVILIYIWRARDEKAINDTTKPL